MSEGFVVNTTLAPLVIGEGITDEDLDRFVGMVSEPSEEDS